MVPLTSKDTLSSNNQSGWPLYAGCWLEATGKVPGDLMHLVWNIAAKKTQERLAHTSSESMVSRVRDLIYETLLNEYQAALDWERLQPKIPSPSCDIGEDSLNSDVASTPRCEDAESQYSRISGPPAPVRPTGYTKKRRTRLQRVARELDFTDQS